MQMCSLVHKLRDGKFIDRVREVLEGRLSPTDLVAMLGDPTAWETAGERAGRVAREKQNEKETVVTADAPVGFEAAREAAQRRD